jgi:cytochrome P450
MTVEMTQALAQPDRVPPSPPGDRIFPHLRQALSDMIGLLFAAAEVGPVAAIRPGPRTAYVLSHPELIGHVLQDAAKNYEKHSVSFVRLRKNFGNGLLFNAGGEFWLRQRRIAAPAFHRARIEKFAEMMSQATQDLVHGWRAVAARGQSVDVATDMVKLTMRIVTLALFTSEVQQDTSDVRDAVSAVVEHVDQPAKAMFSEMRERLFGRNRRVDRALGTLHQVVDRIIAQRRGAAPQNDLLSMLMETRDQETGEGMTDQQLRDEVLSIFLAGHETTANVLSWCWYLLSKNPSIRRSLQTEVATVLGGRAPRLDDLPRLDLSRRVFHEAMRLYPPVWLLQRNAMKADNLGGYDIPAGSVLCFSPYVMHRHPAYWKNPEGFDPDRFLPEAEAQRPKYVYFPFSAGPRICIGNTFALMEAQIILATLVQHFELDLPSGRDVKPELLVTLRPHGGMPMTISARNPG